MGSILIVDDDEAVCTALSEAVTTLGHQAATASDGRVALARFEREGFDVVITDLAMPEVDGLTLLRRVKRRRPETGVVVITGNSTVELLAASVNMGADGYVTKPFRIAELDEHLHRVLAARQARDFPPPVERALAPACRRWLWRRVAAVAGAAALLALAALAWIR